MPDAIPVPPRAPPRPDAPARTEVRSAAPKTPARAAARAWEIDALRGLMLVLMTATHLPTRFATPLGQPFGFVSAAEGFVLLSGFMAGRIYMARQQRHGDDAMRNAFLQRALKLYLWQAALLAFLFSAIALIGSARHQSAIEDLLTFYWAHPVAAFLNGLALIYNPPLLDILPMYVLFMLVSAPLLLQGVRHGWAPILAVSVVLWLCAQFNLGDVVYRALAAQHRVRLAPPGETGSFSILAWQFVWILGLWMGATGVATAPGENAAAPHRFPRWMVVIAGAIAVIGVAWRHAVGQAPFGVDVTLNLLFDKWQLGPLRLLNLLALLLLVLHYGRWLKRAVPRVPVLEALGAASLSVFIAHLVLVLLALAVFGQAVPERPWALDLALIVGAFVLLRLVAAGTAFLERQGRRAGGHVAQAIQRRQAGAAAPGPS